MNNYLIGFQYQFFLELQPLPKQEHAEWMQQIKELKEKIDQVLFSNLSIKKKRIGIRKLSNHGLEKKFVKRNIL